MHKMFSELKYAKKGPEEMWISSDHSDLKKVNVPFN